MQHLTSTKCNVVFIRVILKKKKKKKKHALRTTDLYLHFPYVMAEQYFLLDDPYPFSSLGFEYKKRV